MPEPTNHREQAEHWLAEAAKNWDSGDETGYAHSAALIGIGHALLACAIPSGDKCRGVYSDGYHPDPYRCGLPDGHKPPHLYEPPPIPPAPPLSVSEG